MCPKFLFQCFVEYSERSTLRVPMEELESNYGENQSTTLTFWWIIYFFRILSRILSSWIFLR